MRGRAQGSAGLRELGPGWASFEGRPISGYVAGCDLAPGPAGNRSDPGSELALPGAGSRRRALLVTGGQHGREWLSVTSPLCAVEAVSARLGLGAADVCEDEDGVDLLVVPNMNPDSLVYSQRVFHLWRKNRRPPARQQGEGSGGCWGVDLNRNWPISAGDDAQGQSRNPCANTYKGSFPLSEPETSGFVEWLDQVEAMGYDIVGNLDVHTYGQVILGAFASSDRLPRNAAVYAEAGELMASSMGFLRGVQYEYATGSAGGLLPLTSGTLQDYMHGRGSLSYTLELGPPSFVNETTVAGFLVPTSEMEPVCLELADGIQAFLEFLSNKTAADLWDSPDEE